MKTDHTKWMNEVLAMAQSAQALDEVPVGALLVRGDEVLARSSNAREKTQNPLSHAEADVIQQAAKNLQSWRLEGTVLYVTMEPCLMCTGLIYAARIPKVVFGCKNPKGGSLQYIEERRKELGLNHSVEIMSGVMEKESAQLLKDFFKQKRNA